MRDESDDHNGFTILVRFGSFLDREAVRSDLYGDGVRLFDVVILQI